MNSTIVRVETFIVTLPRDTPYLGPLGPDERINAKGYVVRRGNGTIYPIVDRSVVVRLTTSEGTVGWGETYGICAPRATCEIIDDLLAPVILGRHGEEVETLWDELYGLMRVRGSFGGFYVDAIAALDIALWDIRAKQAARPLWAVLGERRRTTIPLYLSGLPAATVAERVALALDWQRRGHQAFKFAAVVSRDDVLKEFGALRLALGAEADIMVDLHWRYGVEEAISLVESLASLRPAFVEAPVKPEDVVGLAAVGRGTTVPVAAGEEWHTEYEARLRFEAGGVAVVQPEMGHTGITQFKRICARAENYGIAIAPHATIGTGIFLAASLHASLTIDALWRHEWQHSIFRQNLALLDTDMDATAEGYVVPSGNGLGVVPASAFWAHAEAITDQREETK